MKTDVADVKLDEGALSTCLICSTMNSTPPDFSTVIHAEESPLSRSIKFWLLLFGESVSIPTYVFVIYQFVTRRALYGALYNHVVIINLFVNLLLALIDFVCHLIFLRLGELAPSTRGLCLLWQYLDYGFWYCDLSLKFWTSIERHILIFVPAGLNTRRRRFCFHYLPLAFFSLYCPVVYFYLVFIYPTVEQLDFSVLLCGGPSFYFTVPPWFVWYESVVHYVTPIILTIVITAALPLRVFLQKSHLRLSTSWRQYRKMTVQLLRMITIYVFALPYIVVTIVRWSGYSDFGTSVQIPYFYYLAYVPNILFPFTTLGSIPNLKPKVRHCFRLDRNRTANMAIALTARQVRTQTIVR